MGVVALLAIGVPSALAIHQFTDVPDSNPFHTEISAIAGAGITGGKTCVPPGTPPTYCPEEPVNRQAMAAFMHRGFGRVASDQGGSFVLDDFPFPMPFEIVAITISVGGVPGQTQFVQVTGSVGASTETPPDTLAFEIVQDGVGPITILSGFTMGTLGPSGGQAMGHGSNSVAVAVPSGTTQTFRIHVYDFGDSDGIQAWGHLTAITAPFGSTGSSTLDMESTPMSSAGPSR